MDIKGFKSRDGSKHQYDYECLANKPDGGFGGVKSVTRYGATGDGSTDDTAAITAAIADLDAGDTLYFPEGVYRVSNINLKSDMTVRGDGWCSVIQLLDATTDYHGRNNCLNVEDASNIIVRDIKLDGTRATQQSTAASQDGRLNGLHIRNASDILIENVWMYNNGYHGCIMTYASNVVFSHCKATDNGFRPIHGHTQIYNCRLSHCICENNGLGLTGGSGFENDSVFFFGAQYLTISGNIVKSNRRGCITVECENADTGSDDIIPTRNITISGNVCECYEDLAYVPTADSDTGVAKFSSQGIVVIGGDAVLENVTVTGNTIKNAHEAINLYSLEDSAHSINAVITGNTIVDCSYGVYANDVTDIIISDNQFRNLAYAWMYADNIADCVIQNNNVNAPGISEYRMCRVHNSRNVVIRDNNLVGDCARAIYAPESNSGVVVADNTMYGFGTEPVMNPNGVTVGNICDASPEVETTTAKVCVDPYPNAGFVRSTLVNPNTSSTLYRYTTPVEITDADTLYELNTYLTVPVENEDPADYDASAKNTGIVFLTGTDLSTAVGIATISNGNGEVVFSESCIAGTTTNNWGVTISVTADQVRENYPTAAYVMMQVETAVSDPDNLASTYHELNDGHAYVYRTGETGSGSSPDVNGGSGIWYGTTSTAPNTAEKVVTTVTGDFKLVKGARLGVKFLTNTVNCNSLIVDGLEQVYIRSINDEAGNSDTSLPIVWHNLGQVQWFTYDGEYFIIDDSIRATAANSLCGKVAVSDSVSSTGNTVASSTAVKTAYDKAVEALNAVPDDEHINSLINTALGVIENGTY